MAEVIRVSALNRYVKARFEEDELLQDLALRGEIANFVHHRSGHLYFTLRDENASVKAVMFRQNAQRLSFEPSEGMQVVVRCRVGLYEKTGSYQIYVTDLFPDGIGSVQMAFDQLKERLAQEGLFLQERKRPLPLVPKCVGVITSRNGAALQDILNVGGRRWPLAHLLLAPVNVQGEQAVPSMLNALAKLEAAGCCDVILIARGGGSREDLWEFNSEALARAVAKCPIPVVSAVGHEIDYTILDFVADLRAPTPSAAAELIFPDARDVRERICKISEDIQINMHDRLGICYNEKAECAQRWNAVTPQTICAARETVLKAKAPAFQNAMAAKLNHAAARLQNAAALADGLSPYQVLARGYAMVRTEEGAPVRLEKLHAEQKVLLQDAHWQATCQVLALEKQETECNEKSQDV